MKFFQLIPPDTNFDFIGKFKYFVAFSILTCGIVVFGLFTKGLHFGIDFTGGTSVQMRFTEIQDPATLRQLIAELGEKDASVVQLGEDKKEFLITVRTPSQTESKETLAQKVVAKLGAEKVKILQIDVVGPKVGSELKTAAILSLIYSIIGIMIYIWLRFDFKFAPGATIAMVHDLIMATGFYLFSGNEFTITAVAALLTIAGYSVNDTIVIYDRVREMVKAGGDAIPLGQTINKAINLTLSRTLLTSGVTFLSIIPIIIFCTGEIRDFAVAMCFGIFVGSYSTIYIASPLTIYVARWSEGRDSKRPTGRPQTA